MGAGRITTDFPVEAIREPPVADSGFTTDLADWDETMEKRQVLVDLHRMISFRLFGQSRWLPDADACDAISRKFEEWGLTTPTSRDGSSSNTPLGNELEMDSMMIFSGLLSNFDILLNLERSGLIDEADFNRILDSPGFEDDGEEVLRPVVQKAYRDHYGTCARLN
jgi:hypothetical protein